MISIGKIPTRILRSNHLTFLPEVGEILSLLCLFVLTLLQKLTFLTPDSLIAPAGFRISFLNFCSLNPPIQCTRGCSLALALTSHVSHRSSSSPAIAPTLLCQPLWTQYFSFLLFPCSSLICNSQSPKGIKHTA